MITSDGVLHTVNVVDLPALPDSATAPSLSGGTPIGALLDLPKRLAVVGLAPIGATVALGTRRGVVKRVAVEDLAKPEWPLIRLADGDDVVGAAVADDADRHLLFITAHAQLLRFPGSAVRPQGRSAAGMAGIKLGAEDEAVFFGCVRTDTAGAVVTSAASSAALPGTSPGSVKVTDLADYPAKGRGTAGVRCQRFRSGEDRLQFAWAGTAPVRAATQSGMAVTLPETDHRRDGTGSPADKPLGAAGGAVG